MVVKKDCSTVKDFVSEYIRMCDRVESCVACPLNRTGVCEIPSFIEGVRNGTYKTLMKNVAPILQEWYDANPIQRKTWLEDFLEKFPDARIAEDGTPEICHQLLDRNWDCENYISCAECWNRTMD